MNYPISYHGLVAYSSKKSAVGLWRAAKTAERCAEVCVADRPIGPVGIVLQGEITALYEADCWSAIDDDGFRRPTKEVPQLKTPADHREYVGYVKEARDSLAPYGNYDYTEGFMRGCLVRAVWVKDWATEYKATAQHLATVLGVELIPLPHGTRRIWEDYPTDDTAEARYDHYTMMEEKL